MVRKRYSICWFRCRYGICDRLPETSSINVTVVSSAPVLQLQLLNLCVSVCLFTELLLVSLYQNIH
uniref:Uncharacterized protein n=1 Tax=Anguilla anguilla TaxID=7936 RepID=A0A0E9XV71_ANGAN